MTGSSNNVFSSFRATTITCNPSGLAGDVGRSAPLEPRGAQVSRPISLPNCYEMSGTDMGNARYQVALAILAVFGGRQRHRVRDSGNVRCAVQLQVLACLASTSNVAGHVTRRTCGGERSGSISTTLPSRSVLLSFKRMRFFGNFLFASLIF